MKRKQSSATRFPARRNRKHVEQPVIDNIGARDLDDRPFRQEVDQALGDRLIRQLDPRDADLSDSFFATDLMTEYSQAVVLEGDAPLRFVDLRVFVAPPPAEGHQLFVRCTHTRERDARGSTVGLEQLLREPDGMVDVLGVIGGARLAELGREHPDLLEKMRSRLGGVAQARRAPLPDQRWAIADSYAGIEHAQLVVVNAREDCQRQAAEQLVADILRLRKDNDLRTDILGPRGSRIPITAVAANVVDPDDPARKKALARVRRAIRSAAS